MPSRGSPPAVPPPKPISDDLITLVEMVDLFAVKRVTVDQWAQRRRNAANQELAFPEPDDYVADKPVWRLPRLKIWATVSGKAWHEDEWRAKREAGGYRITRK
ncbi:MAG: hypothetical protein LC792_17655 [Actinobacteria bacterium]|nr:hypothetical protein [Actinomycetota bacterium]